MVCLDPRKPALWSDIKQAHALQHGEGLGGVFAFGTGPDG